MLPEEKELARLEAQQAELQEQVASAELELETLKTETARFRHRYYEAVGGLYAEFDEIEAKIAGAREQKDPTDATLKARARAAEQKARESAKEAHSACAAPEPATSFSPALKQAYRQAVKLLHPDLALSEHERERRTKLMAEVNLAYERGDKSGIEKLVEEFGTTLMPLLARMLDRASLGRSAGSRNCVAD
jgi:hypothetical protein